MLTQIEIEFLEALLRSEFDTRSKFYSKSSCLKYRDKCDIIISLMKKLNLSQDKIEDMEADYICEFIY